MFKLGTKFSTLIFIFYTSIFLTQSYAASFDCTKARSNIEIAICDDAQLSQLDEKLAKEYKSSRAKLSAASNKVLTASQRSWLKFTATYCFIDTNASSVSGSEATSCLVKAYKDRIADLSKTGKIVGEYITFTAIDHHIRVLKDKEAVYVIKRKFTQVNDDTPAIKNLNRYLSFKEKAVLPDERGTESYDIQLTQISPDWLYKQEFSEIFTGAYPTNETKCGVYSMSQNRLLKVSDFFQNTTWEKIFETESKKHFFDLAKTEKDFDITIVSDFRPSIALSSSLFKYCLSKKGIELYGFLPHVARAYDGVTVSWTSLSKVLTPYAQEQVKKMDSL